MRTKNHSVMPRPEDFCEPPTPCEKCGKLTASHHKAASDLIVLADDMEMGARKSVFGTGYALSNTDDAEGIITPNLEAGVKSEQEVRQALKRFEGEIDQNKFDAAMEAGLDKLKIPGITDAQKKAIDDKVIEAMRKFGRVTDHN